MHALVRYANIAAGSTFTTADLYPPVLDALGLPQFQYSLALCTTESSRFCVYTLFKAARTVRQPHKWLGNPGKTRVFE
jgi:hypothetical protein